MKDKPKEKQEMVKWVMGLYQSSVCAINFTLNFLADKANLET